MPLVVEYGTKAGCAMKLLQPDAIFIYTYIIIYIYGAPAARCRRSAAWLELRASCPKHTCEDKPASSIQVARRVLRCCADINTTSGTAPGNSTTKASLMQLHSRARRPETLRQLTFHIGSKRYVPVCA